MLGNGDVPASDMAGLSSSESTEDCLECGDPSILSLADKGLEGRAVRPGLGASSFGVREANSLFESDSAMVRIIHYVLENVRNEFSDLEVQCGVANRRIPTVGALGSIHPGYPTRYPGL